MFFYFISLFSEIRCYILIISDIIKDIERHDLLIANARHYEALQRARTSLERVIEGLDTNLSADFIAQDLRETLAHLGAITGAITSSEILQTVFSRFCIGK